MLLLLLHVMCMSREQLLGSQKHGVAAPGYELCHRVEQFIQAFMAVQ